MVGSAETGRGTGTYSANTGGSAPSGMGTNASSTRPGPSARPGMGAQDTGTGTNLTAIPERTIRFFNPPRRSRGRRRRPEEMPALE
jgi:hypothetical protein